MQKIDKDKVLAKWQPILDKYNLPEDKRCSLAEYAEAHATAGIDQRVLNFPHIPVSAEMQKQYDKNLEILKNFKGPIIPLSIRIAGKMLDCDLDIDNNIDTHF